MAHPALDGLRLRGRLLELRPFTEADITATYLGWLNDPLVVRYSNQRFREHDAAGALAYLRGFDAGANLFLSARRMDSGEAVGTLTAYIAPPHGTADVGIMIGERSGWGQGLGQDAWDTLLQWLLGERGLRKVTAGALACNLGMIRLMEHSGMQLEGARRAQEIVDGEPVDVLYYARFAAA